MTTENNETIITINCRAVGGRLERNKVCVDEDGTVRVYDGVAGHYTTCHSLSARDIARIRRAVGVYVEVRYRGMQGNWCLESKELMPSVDAAIARVNECGTLGGGWKIQAYRKTGDALSEVLVTRCF